MYIHTLVSEVWQYTSVRARADSQTPVAIAASSHRHPPSSGPNNSQQYLELPKLGRSLKTQYWHCLLQALKGTACCAPWLPAGAAVGDWRPGWLLALLTERLRLAWLAGWLAGLCWLALSLVGHDGRWSTQAGRHLVFE